MIKKLYNKYRHLVLYAVFGVLTTLVNIVSYSVCARVLHIPTVPANVIAWILAVLFAYLTNRKWVFESKATTVREILIEIGLFFFFRLATGVLDTLIMFIFVDVLHFNDIVIKVVANIIVIVLNYVASKLIIFKKKKED